MESKMNDNDNFLSDIENDEDDEEEQRRLLQMEEADEKRDKAKRRGIRVQQRAMMDVFTDDQEELEGTFMHLVKI